MSSIHLDRYLHLLERLVETNEKIDEVIEWILNIQPLVNDDYKDELAERVGYIFDENYDMYVRKD